MKGLGEVGYRLLAMLWIGHQRTVKRRAQHLDDLRMNLAVLQARLKDAIEREEGLIWQMDKLILECRNEARVSDSSLATLAAPMRRLRSMRTRAR